MRRVKDFVVSVGYWINAQFRPINEVTARELKFVDDVEGHYQMCLLVEEDEAECVFLELILGRVTEIRVLAKKYRRHVRRAMTARIGAVLSDNWQEFGDRVVAEMEVLEDLAGKIVQLRGLCPEISSRTGHYPEGIAM
ncbi:MAG: hypothetical protein AAB613_01145 [Patescibacteria group bacterium]